IPGYSEAIKKVQQAAMIPGMIVKNIVREFMGVPKTRQVVLKEQEVLENAYLSLMSELKQFSQGYNQRSDNQTWESIAERLDSDFQEELWLDFLARHYQPYRVRLD